LLINVLPPGSSGPHILHESDEHHQRALNQRDEDFPLLMKPTFNGVVRATHAKQEPEHFLQRGGGFLSLLA
jgi:hypothetical protein